MYAYQGHEKIVEILIREGADVNFKKSDGRTPLHTAVQEGTNNQVEWFNENCASILLCNIQQVSIKWSMFSLKMEQTLML